jgi:hypothetical protein
MFPVQKNSFINPNEVIERFVLEIKGWVGKDAL